MHKNQGWTKTVETADICLRGTEGTTPKHREVSCFADAPWDLFPSNYKLVLTHLASSATHISQPRQLLQGFSQALDEEAMRIMAKISDNKVILFFHPLPFSFIDLLISTLFSSSLKLHKGQLFEICRTGRA